MISHSLLDLSKYTPEQIERFKELVELYKDVDLDVWPPPWAKSIEFLEPSNEPERELN